MAPRTGTEGEPRGSLTERNIALHNALEESKESGDNVMSWMEKVIAEERIHKYYSQLGAERFNLHNQGLVDIEHAMGRLSHVAFGSNTQGSNEQMSESLKLFEQHQQGVYRETPLERFLTPDGCSDLSYYARGALAEMETEFGDMEGQEKRREKAKNNVELVIRNKHRKE
ncbi:hypothetical protein BDV23DRAFT_196440 [Aspergillus alliaceus]|uniref:Uncharacterized protein n=1 Tax=Petromyces alliaceus TaxID=209559 RepID=A0A5N7BX65_PETAA|nr:hypothetical protein BDV23DRAFT_196440 [Aspergillus alliaceus]